MRLELGTPVRCQDGMLGELADVVIDPVRRSLTHIIVRPEIEALVGARLVPIDLVEPAEEQKVIALRCTVDHVRGLDPVQGFAYEGFGALPVDDPDWDVGVADVLASPVYTSGEMGAGSYVGAAPMSYDRIPKDDVELRRSSPVRSSDGHHLGHVDALVVDANDNVTHFELEHRRLWTRHKIRIAVASIKEIDTDAVTVGLTKKQVRALPSERVPRS
jgi:sporulation protein YlmC with PRC-barrel domain